MIYPQILNLPNEDISILLRLDNHSSAYLCDCGTASGLTVKDSQALDAIFISHTHIDHFVNFDTILRHQLGMTKTVVICGPKGIAKQVQAKTQSYIWNLIKEGDDNICYEIREIHSSKKVEVYQIRPPHWELEFIKTINLNKEALFENKAFKVDFTLLDHGTPTVAYHFEEHSKVNIDISKSEFRPGAWIKELKQAHSSNNLSQKINVEDTTYLAKDLFCLLSETKGYRLGFIMDHGANQENHDKIKVLFSNADKVFIESYYLHSELELAEKNFHSTALLSGKIMREAKIKEAIPVHFSRRYSEEEIELLKEEFYKKEK